MSRGGYRAGAGRPKGAKTLKLDKAIGAAAGGAGCDPLEYLLGVVGDGSADPELRIRCAVAALPYTSPKADANSKAKRRIEAEKAEIDSGWDALLNDIPEKYRPRRVRPFGSD
jgi:hypothetical protein